MGFTSSSNTNEQGYLGYTLTNYFSDPVSIRYGELLFVPGTNIDPRIFLLGVKEPSFEELSIEAQYQYERNF